MNIFLYILIMYEIIHFILHIKQNVRPYYILFIKLVISVIAKRCV